MIVGSFYLVKFITSLLLFKPIFKVNISLSKGKEARPLIGAAGSDITFWFDSNTREPRTKVNTSTG